MMRTDIAILKGLFLPVFEELTTNDSDFKKSLPLESFWNYFNNVLLDVKETEEFIKQFKIVNINHYIEIFDNLRKEYISELALEYSNGYINPAIGYLIKHNNALFNEELRYHKDLNIAISLLEQQNLKKHIKNIELEEKFTIQDDEIETAYKLLQKAEDEKLKNKIKSWDLIAQHEQIILKSISTVNKNLYEEESATGSTISRDLQKVDEKKIHISSYLKFAIAACIFGIVFFIGKVFYDENKQSSVALTEKHASGSEPEPFNNTEIKERKFSSIKSTTTSIEAIEQTGIGFGPTSKKVYKLVTLNSSFRLKELINYSDSLRAKNLVINSKIIREIDSLKALSGKYIFFENTIQIYTKAKSGYGYKLLNYKGKYYLQWGNTSFYELKRSKSPKTFLRLKDSRLIDSSMNEILEKILFENA
jgi:hypothetical protein